MRDISTAMELQDNFTGIMMNIVNLIYRSAAAVEQMQSVMSGMTDTGSIAQGSEALQTFDDTLQNMESPSMISSAMDYGNMQAAAARQDQIGIPDNSGMQRFGQAAQRTNAILQQLGRTQRTIARRAYNADIFLPEAFQNLNTMAAGMDHLSDHIRQIGNHPLNMGMDAVNAELEQMRVQMNQAVHAQELINRTIQNMDVRAANGAYQKLLKIIGNTERNIQSNVDEQNYFNDGVREGIEGAAELKNRIADAAKSIMKMDKANIKDWIVDGIADWIVDCTSAFDTQLDTEIRRISVLASMLDEEYIARFGVEVGADTTAVIYKINAIQDNINGVVVPVTAKTQALTAAYGQIAEKAGEIQGRGAFEEEAMIAGAVKLFLYFSEPEAVTDMMDTLSDYAMGMSVLEGKSLAVDVNSMVGYAANLGKITIGDHTAMSQEGFEFTDAQKAVIGGTATEVQIEAALGAEYLDMSTDMQAAAVIASVIGREWEGLYEIMSNTPEGKILQLANAWGSMKEVVGGQLYPYVVLFVDTITQNWGTIQEVIGSITYGLQMMLGVLSWLMEGAMNFAQAVMDNWGWISPIIYGIIGVLAVYGTYLAITKGFELVSAVVKGIHAVAIWAVTRATWAEITAQNGLNAAMYACPIVWIIALIIALIAVFYMAIAMINKFTGTSVSATGIICGLVMVAVASIGNMFVALINFGIDIFVMFWNFIAAFANFFGNVFNDPVGAVARIFCDLANMVLEGLETIAIAIDTIFGSNFAETTAGWRNSLGGWVDETFGQGEEIMEKLDVSSMYLGEFEYKAAWDAGYSFGEGIDKSIANFDPSCFFGVMDIPSADDYANALVGGGIGNDINNIAGNTGAMADSMEITEEELKYLRDIAEQEAINRFTTAEIRLEQTNHNTIKNGMDLDGIVSGMTDMMNEAIGISTEGVHV